ncbi:Myotubularin-related protein 2 [Thelohanellus kitauei]|uniref:Myotubularin-related protein 2 n=1 Tax=Thelohanellus kitauei TaxID=669202 RepID=A0A0C2MQG0_THEKT|nr:Myotubularin-related protein 2 [Thelohanellus kitauei]
MLAGEKILYTCDILYWDDRTRILAGQLSLTNLWFHFISTAEFNEKSNSTLDQEPQVVFSRDIQFGHFERIESGTTSCGLTKYFYHEITLRQFSNFKLLSPTDDDNFKTLQVELMKFAFPLSNNLVISSEDSQPMPAFVFKGEYKHNGWNIYSPLAEYERMGVPNDLWRITYINENYGLCSTYPKILCVPSTSTDDLLEKVKEFRQKGRIPVLSWVHPKNQCTITRCSQPRTRAIIRNTHDEDYFQAILDATPSCHKLIIIDARPFKNAVSNQVIGGGVEDTKNYNNSVRSFINIENIHVMRESYQKLRVLCTNDYRSLNWMTILENTKWLDHIVVRLF